LFYIYGIYNTYIKFKKAKRFRSELQQLGKQENLDPVLITKGKTANIESTIQHVIKEEGKISIQAQDKDQKIIVGNSKVQNVESERRQKLRSNKKSHSKTFKQKFFTVLGWIFGIFALLCIIVTLVNDAPSSVEKRELIIAGFVTAFLFGIPGLIFLKLGKNN
jgi:hypothetical protein